MGSHAVIVIGAGISGLSFALEARRAGHDVLVLDAGPTPGGCLSTARSDAGFWLELGAHTLYNSYATLIDHFEHLGLMSELQARGKPCLRFLDGDAVAPGSNLGALLARMSKWQLLASLPKMIGASQEGRTVAEYYGRIVGRENFERVLGPMLSAVPSQRADDFPADMLFKKRARRKDVLRSFTLKGGLARVAEAVAATPGIEVRSGAAATRVRRMGSGFEVSFAEGRKTNAALLALATPPSVSAQLLQDAAPELAAAIAPLKEAALHTTGVVVRAEKVAHIPYSTFLIPTGDVFHSIVTRDVVADESFRGFSFHFKPGVSPEERRARISAVLRIDAGELELVAERAAVLPSPVLGHRDVIAKVDAQLAEQRGLAITGNWFGGLAIEDCVLRSRAEWKRLSGASA